MRGKSEKERKSKEAAERNAAYSKLSPKQKLEKLDNGQFRAIKQRQKLEALIQ